MFNKKSKSKSNVQLGSKESLGSSAGNLSSTSSENLFGHENPEVASLYRVTQFELNFLGMIQEVNLSGIQTRDPDVQLIDKVEESQLEGKIHLVAKNEDRVTLTVSRHGIKVLDRQKREVLQRHPLHSVAQVVCYIDSFFKNNLALKIGQVGKSVYDCYVFQCHSEEQSQNVCQSIKGVFDIVACHGS